MKASVSGTIGDLMREHYAVVHPPMGCVLGDPNPTVGDLMARFTAVVYKPNGYLKARPAWERRQPRRRD